MDLNFLIYTCLQADSKNSGVFPACAKYTSAKSTLQIIVKVMERSVAREREKILTPFAQEYSFCFLKNEDLYL